MNISISNFKRNGLDTDSAACNLHLMTLVHGYDTPSDHKLFLCKVGTSSVPI